MVGLPNRTGRCTICKRMKIKCDLSRPACSRCRQLGRRCEYPVVQQGQIFINRDVTNPFVKALDVFSNASKTKLCEKSVPKQATVSYTCHFETLKHSIPNSPDPDPVYLVQLLSNFMGVYHPDMAQDTTRAGQTPASWVHLLPDITLTDSAYNASLAALCVEQLGSWNHDPVLVRDSSRLYGSALGELRKTIGGRKLAAPDATLANVVLLSTYEQFSSSPGQDSRWASHVQGGSHLLQLLGSGVHETPVGRLLFAKLRTMIIFHACRTRQTSILVGLQWPHCADIGESHGLYCHLQDLMTQLPAIMELLDKTAERPGLDQLLQSCLSLNEQLLAWNEKLSDQVHGQLYWIVPSVARNPADDPVLGRIFPLAFQFPNLGIAQLHLMYWSMLVLLYRTIQDIQKRLKKQLTSDASIQQSSGHQDRDRSELCSDYSHPSNEQISLLANNISQSFEYCYHTKSGTHGLQSTIFPRWVAQSFYESQPDRGQELAWCSELGNMTAPDSQFDLFVMKLGENGSVGSCRD